jgi:hypothetical protein
MPDVRTLHDVARGPGGSVHPTHGRRLHREPLPPPAKRSVRQLVTGWPGAAVRMAGVARWGPGSQVSENRRSRTPGIRDGGRTQRSGACAGLGCRIRSGQTDRGLSFIEGLVAQQVGTERSGIRQKLWSRVMTVSPRRLRIGELCQRTVRLGRWSGAATGSGGDLRGGAHSKDRFVFARSHATWG